MSKEEKPAEKDATTKKDEEKEKPNDKYFGKSNLSV